MIQKMSNIDDYEDSLSGKDKKFLASIKRGRIQYVKGQVVDMSTVFTDVII
jgi:hypothetical protein